jgi:hypothetical protein
MQSLIDATRQRGLALRAKKGSVKLVADNETLKQLQLLNGWKEGDDGQLQPPSPDDL